MLADIFVFGSNLAGIHKRGAALHALNECGAILGQGIGLQMLSYAIPTKRTPYETLPLIEIAKHVSDFIVYAYYTPENQYQVTPIGCGLAGYKPDDIAPMFYYAQLVKNIHLPADFLIYLRE